MNALVLELLSQSDRTFKHELSVPGRRGCDASREYADELMAVDSRRAILQTDATKTNSLDSFDRANARRQVSSFIGVTRITRDNADFLRQGELGDQSTSLLLGRIPLCDLGSEN